MMHGLTNFTLLVFTKYHACVPTVYCAEYKRAGFAFRLLRTSYHKVFNFAVGTQMVLFVFKNNAVVVAMRCLVFTRFMDENRKTSHP
jgi:hypothetical protein